MKDKKIKKTKNIFLKYILESVIVTFGVVLGLFLSDWNTQRKTDINTETTLNYIIAELESNLPTFEAAIKYHQQIGIEFDSAAKSIKDLDLDNLYYNNTSFKHYDLPSWNGMGTVAHENIVYESAKISGVFQELNISTIQKIEKIYKQLEFYEEFSKAPLDKFLEVDSQTKIVDIYRIIELMKYDILNAEKSVLKKLEEAIVDLKETIYNKKYSQ